MLTKQLINACQKYNDQVALISAEDSPAKNCPAESPEQSGNPITYRQLLEKSYFLRDYLAGKTGSPQIGILLPNSPEFVISFLAIRLLGKTPVPINYLLSRPEIEHIITEANLDTVLTSAYFKKLLNNIPNPVYLDFLHASSPAQTTGLIKPDPDSSQFKTDGLATILYTSGTSGLPKGVMLSDANILSNIKSFSQAMPLTSEHTILGILPYFHAFGLTCALLYPLLTGGTIVLVKKFNPAQLGELITKHDIRCLLTVPSIYRAMLRLPPNSLKNVQLCISGGEALPAEVW